MSYYGNHVTTYSIKKSDLHIGELSKVALMQIDRRK